ARPQSGHGASSCAWRNLRRPRFRARPAGSDLMSTDAFHRRGPSAMNPPASLTSVRVKRRASLVPPSGKRGDLTDGGDASETPETRTMSAPEAPTITQAAMDAHHEARVAEAAAVARAAGA